MNRYKPYALAYVSLSLGFGSMILFAVFLFMGSFSLFDLGLNQSNALLMDACLSLLFFAQHSVMIRRGIQEKLSKLIADVYYSAVYSIVSGITLIAIILLWQKTPGLIASADGLYSWMLRALFFVCIAGFHWGTTSLVSFDPFGVKKIERHLRHKETKSMPMTVQGAYRWVRHPLYFFSLVMIWANPNLTTDRLLFNILWSIWIVIATMFEERDLIHDFGKEYREYQAKVPMIIPYKFPYKA